MMDWREYLRAPNPFKRKRDGTGGIGYGKRINIVQLGLKTGMVVRVRRGDKDEPIRRHSQSQMASKHRVGGRVVGAQRTERDGEAPRL